MQRAAVPFNQSLPMNCVEDCTHGHPLVYNRVMTGGLSDLRVRKRREGERGNKEGEEEGQKECAFIVYRHGFLSLRGRGPTGPRGRPSGRFS
jgi:hypothetical protein